MAPEDPAITRAAAAATLGHRTHLTPEDLATLEKAAADPDPRVRAAALAALIRAGEPTDALATWQAALTDESPEVRRRAADLARTLPTAPAEPLIALLDDEDVTVVVAVAEALGEQANATDAIAPLATTTTDHPDPLAREAAAAALGALGDERGLEAILQACTDKPTVRRRAVLALASFEGREVERALARALEDKDWQVRQAAEDLTER